MARRSVSNIGITPTATADTTNLVDATYPWLIQGGSATQLSRIHEVSLNGLSGASAPTPMILARDSTVATGSNTNGTGQTDAPLDGATAALAAPALTGNSNATVKPQRSSTLHLLLCALNAFGGAFFWRANKIDECPAILGNTASLGEASLSCTTGGTAGLISGHMIYETL